MVGRSLLLEQSILLLWKLVYGDQAIIGEIYAEMMSIEKRRPYQRAASNCEYCSVYFAPAPNNRGDMDISSNI